MFSIPAILLYILFFVVGWLIARWRGAQQQTAHPMAPPVETPRAAEPRSTAATAPSILTPDVKSEPDTTKPDTTKPEADKPESGKPETGKPETGKSAASAAKPAATASKPASTTGKAGPANRKSTSAAKPKPKPKPAKAETKPVAAADPNKPERLKAPRDGEADDLKRVKGIGPANEKKLNAFGIYHFDQIANWSAEQAEFIGKELSFPGRIEREDWIEQAKVLASGGDTEFSKRADKR